MFRRIWEAGLAHYDDLKGIDLEWLCADGSQGKAPLGGKKSGPNPTDRGKRGVKRSVLCDGRGVVLGMVIEGANCPDLKLLPQTLECVPSSCKQRKRFEQASHLCLDKGYDCQALRQWLHQQGFIAHIPRRGQEPKPNQTGRWEGASLGRRTDTRLAQSLPAATRTLGEEGGQLRGHAPSCRCHYRVSISWIIRIGSSDRTLGLMRLLCMLLQISIFYVLI